MPNIGAVLKDEITRLARKAVKEMVGPVQSAAGKQRLQLSALRKEVEELRRQLAQLERQARKTKAPEPDVDATLRFTAKGFASLRKKLDLSAEDMGRLVGVGFQTIYSWEKDGSKPRRSHYPAIAELRKIGKREAQRRLAALLAG